MGQVRVVGVFVGLCVSGKVPGLGFKSFEDSAGFFLPRNGGIYLNYNTGEWNPPQCRFLSSGGIEVAFESHLLNATSV